MANPQTLNPYAYVNNNSLAARGRDGHFLEGGPTAVIRVMSLEPTSRPQMIFGRVAALAGYLANFARALGRAHHRIISYEGQHPCLTDALLLAGAVLREEGEDDEGAEPVALPSALRA